MYEIYKMEKRTGNLKLLDYRVKAASAKLALKKYFEENRSSKGKFLAIPFKTRVKYTIVK